MMDRMGVEADADGEDRGSSGVSGTDIFIQHISIPLSLRLKYFITCSVAIASLAFLHWPQDQKVSCPPLHLVCH